MSVQSYSNRDVVGEYVALMCVRDANFRYDKQDLRIPELTFVEYKQAGRGVSIHEYNEEKNDYSATGESLRGIGSTWKFLWDVPVDIDLKVDYNLSKYVPSGSADVTIRNPHIRGAVSIYIEEHLETVTVHFTHAPRVKLGQVRVAVKSSSRVVAGIGQATAAVANAAVGPEQIKALIRAIIRKKIDEQIEPFVDNKAVRIHWDPHNVQELLESRSIDMLVQTKTANPHKHGKVTLQRDGQHQTLSALSDKQWNDCLRQFITDAVTSEVLCRRYAQKIIETISPLRNTDQMLCEIRNTRGSCEGLILR
eukprot:COSAG02_NODE_2430_length_8883_cov_3.641621_2_plen_308_part_00